MSNYNLEVGINLNGRTIYCEIPAGTSITAKKYIAKTHNPENYIAEENGQAYYHYNDEVHIFYDATHNVSDFTLPVDFGVITEVDNTAVTYEYISRTSHEKVYVVSEDFARQESLNKEQIEANVDEQVRSYGLPTDSVIGFDGDEIPDGFEVVEYDTGWIDLPLASGITEYGAAAQYDCMYRKIGNIVYVIGCVKGITANNTPIATLPVNYRPINTYRYLTGRNITGNSILSLAPNGTLTFVGLTEGASIAATDFVYIQTSFLID